MKFAFYMLATWTMASGLLAVTMRNLLHCAIALIAFFAGIAAIFFSLHAEFLGAVQIVVYIGAVAVLVLFAIMLTRNVTGSEGTSPFSGGAVWGILVAGILLVAILSALHHQVPLEVANTPATLSVADIGRGFMTRYAVPFEVISLLLTAALVGAVVIALEEPKEKS